MDPHYLIEYEYSAAPTGGAENSDSKEEKEKLLTYNIQSFKMKYFDISIHIKCYTQS